MRFGPTLLLAVACIGGAVAAPGAAASECSISATPGFCERSTTNATTIATSVSAAPIR